MISFFFSSQLVGVAYYNARGKKRAGRIIIPGLVFFVKKNYLWGYHIIFVIWTSKVCAFLEISRIACLLNLFVLFLVFFLFFRSDCAVFLSVFFYLGFRFFFSFFSLRLIREAYREAYTVHFFFRVLWFVFKGTTDDRGHI